MAEDIKLTISGNVSTTKVSGSYNKLPSIKTDENIEIANSDVDIELQEFYDNSINVIVNDEVNNIRLINSGFHIEDGKLESVSRNNNTPSNIYNDNIDSISSLILYSSKAPTIEYNICEGGNLAGGNYFFYIKYGTSDGDATDIVEESPVIPIFKGNESNPKSVSGAVLDEMTNKSIELILSDFDKNYSKVYLYYSRYTCDTNGIKVEKFYKITDGYDIALNKSTVSIIITGDEETEEISAEELNISYMHIKSARSIAQHQGRLFVAGVNSEDQIYDKDLQEISISSVTLNAERRYLKNGINYNYEGSGYYSSENISYNTGYWPEEFYRFGIVYVYKNGQCSCVYDIKGGLLEVESGMLSNAAYENDRGVVYIHDDHFYDEYTKDPYIELTANLNLSEDSKTIFSDKNITGYFFVRQNRIPVNILQGVINAVEDNTGFPCLKYKGPDIWDTNQRWSEHYDAMKFQYNNNEEWNWVESFLRVWKDWYKDKYGDEMFCAAKELKFDEWHHKLVAIDRPDRNFYPYHYGILNTDSYCVPQIQSIMSNNEFYVCKVGTYGNAIAPDKNGNVTGDERRIIPISVGSTIEWKKVADYKNAAVKVPLVYVPEDTPSICINKLRFSTRAGSAEDVKSVGYISLRDETYEDKALNGSIIRGTATSFIGITDYSDIVKDTLKPNDLVIVRTIPYYDIDYNIVQSEVTKRENDNSPFYAISERISINNININRKLRGGDCFINVNTIRMQTNFIDPDTQINDTIVGMADNKVISDTWVVNYKGINQEEATDFSKINRSDINASKIGTWYTYKSRSNYNMAFRCEDKSHADEMNRMGNWRSFYPIRDIDVSAANKVPESNILNLGMSSVLSAKRYYNMTSEDVPYDNTNYENRICFSNPYVKGSFENGYRIFQGLSYQDYTRAYGKITKILSFAQSLFCVFEHGCAIIPINEKALISTTEGQSIHMYGSGVLPDQITVISQNYGSRWKSSIIQTPNGIYGVDTDARVIWRFNSTDGFVLISNLRVGKFLHENLNISDIMDDTVKNGIKQVRTHYNLRKMDVMFTYIYTKDDKTECFNLCFNEILNIFVCKYSWMPLVSENINNEFVSFNRDDDALIPVYNDKDSIESASLWNHGKKNKNILPTNWYGEQHPFEFEFVVNTPHGLHKIFDNLVIISNNVEPESLEIQITGDVYNFNKAKILDGEDQIKFPEIEIADNKKYSTSVIVDNQNDDKYTLKVHQDCVNMKDYGRRLGNIYYNHDVWYSVIQPIYYKEDSLKTARVRDKYAIIRIKYSGEQLVTISAIQTLMTLSYV